MAESDHPGAVILVRAEEMYKHARADPAAAVAQTALLLAEARTSGNREALVVALRAAAWARRGTASSGTAQQLLNEAVKLADKHNLDDRLADVLMSRAAVLSELGRTAGAQRDLERARGLVPRSRRPELALAQATLLANLGRADEAVRLLKVVALDAAADLDQRVRANNNLGYLEVQRGHFENALRYVEAAAREAPAAGVASDAMVTQTRAWVNVQAGRLSDAMMLFTRAGALYEQAGIPLGEHFIEYADALTDLRLLPEALAAASHAVQELESTPLMQAEARLRVARLLLLMGDRESARTTATETALSLRRQGRPGWVARAVALAHEAQAPDGLSPAQVRSLRGCAEALRENGMLADSIEAYLVLGRTAGPRQLDDLREARRLAARSAVLTRLKGRIAGALAAQAAGTTADVVRHCRKGLDDLASHRDSLPSMELRALATGHGVELGTLALQSLLPQRRASHLLSWMEQTRAAALVSTAPQTAPDAERTAAATDISALANELRAHQAEVEAADVRGEPQPRDTRARITELEDRIRRESWKAVDSLTSAAVVSTSALKTLLGPAVLVEYAVLGNQIHAVVLDSRRARLVDLGAVDDVVRDTDSLLFAMRRLARAGASTASQDAARAGMTVVLERLRGRLISPLGLHATAPLVVIPVGALQRVPWTPLHDGPVTVAPSATVWARTCDGAIGRPASVALVAGPGLPGAEREVTALRTIHPEATHLGPERSTAEATLLAMQGSDLAHLACHGRIRADNPLFSSLVLADGPLTVHELSSRITAPRQVVLAACDSAVQTTFAGDESLGFVSALLARGTRGLLASTVLLPDLDTVPLVLALHEQLRGGAPISTALHRARQAMNPDNPGELVASCAFQAYGAG